MSVLKPSYIIAAVVAVAATGWVLSGQIGNTEGAADSAVPALAPTQPERPPQVRVRIQRAESHAAEIVLRGRTEAERSVELRAETRGTVDEIMVEKGALVAADQVILQLSQDDRLARLRQVKALLDQRRIEFEAADQLSKKGYRSDTAVAEALARLEEAKAAVAAMEIDIAYTTVRAPFDGIVDERPAEIGDFVDIGDPIATIVDLDPILVVGQISERDIGEIALGSRGSARMINGTVLNGTVRYISTTADDTTRTFRVELEIPNPTRRLSQGVSSEMHLPLPPLSAHLVSPAILTLADDGTLGVKLVNEEGVVEFHPASVVADGPEGVWLAGLPERATFITVGQEFVVAGQKVEAIPEESTPAS